MGVLRPSRVCNAPDFKSIGPSICEGLWYHPVRSPIGRPFNIICQGHRFFLSTFNLYYSTQSKLYFLSGIISDQRLFNYLLPTPFQCHSSRVRVRVWCRIYPSSHPQGYFPYVICLRLTLFLCKTRRPCVRGKFTRRASIVYGCSASVAGL